MSVAPAVLHDAAQVPLWPQCEERAPVGGGEGLVGFLGLT